MPKVINLLIIMHLALRPQKCVTTHSVTQYQPQKEMVKMSWALQRQLVRPKTVQVRLK